MSNKYKFGDYDYAYFVTYTVVGRVDLITRDIYRNVILNSLNFCIEHKGLNIFAWVMMTNHIHLIMNTDGRNRPEAIMRDHKRHTSEQIHKLLRNNRGESRAEWMKSILTEYGTKNSNNK